GDAPVSRSRGALKKRMRPASASTHTSDIVVSVRIRANSSPRTKSVCDIEQRDLVVLERNAARSQRFGAQLTELVPCLGARLQRGLVGPERQDERLALLPASHANEPAEPGALPEPGKKLVAHELEAEVVLLRSRLEDVDTREHVVVLHCPHALRAATGDRL